MNRAILESLEPRQFLSGTVYQFDFEQPKDAAGHYVSEMVPWNYRTTSTAPNGQKFLGELGGAQSATLTLNNIAPHTTLTIDFDLYIIRGWSGDSDQAVYANSNPATYGQDLWSLTANSDTLFSTTFSNTPAQINNSAGDYRRRDGTYTLIGRPCPPAMDRNR